MRRFQISLLERCEYTLLITRHVEGILRHRGIRGEARQVFQGALLAGSVRAIRSLNVVINPCAKPVGPCR